MFTSVVLVAIIVMLSLSIISSLLILHGLLSEKRAFNNGKCLYCGSKLKKSKDSDRFESRMYTCPKCGHKVFISFDTVDKDFKEGEP